MAANWVALTAASTVDHLAAGSVEAKDGKLAVYWAAWLERLAVALRAALKAVAMAAPKASLTAGQTAGQMADLTVAYLAERTEPHKVVKTAETWVALREPK